MTIVATAAFQGGGGPVPDLATSVTLAQSGSSVGYNGGSYGSVVPTTPMLNSQEIDVIQSITGSLDFEIHILGLFLAQTFFDHVIVENGNDVDEQFDTSAATFSTTSTRATWKWGDGSTSTLVWDTFDDPEVHPADFFL